MKCEHAGIGRQARLRGVCQPTCGFKSHCSHQILFYLKTKFILPDCVKVAQQTLTLFVWVRILVRQPHQRSKQKLTPFCFLKHKKLTTPKPLNIGQVSSTFIIQYFLFYIIFSKNRRKCILVPVKYANAVSFAIYSRI